MKKRVWITRARMTQGACYRLWIVEPFWDEKVNRWTAVDLTTNSIPVCKFAAATFLVKRLEPGECIEVKTSPGQVWVAPQ